MHAEENRQLAILLSAGSSTDEREGALRRIAEILEEDHILNLPPSGRALDGLKRFASRADADPKSKARARRLVKTYDLP